MFHPSVTFNAHCGTFSGELPRQHKVTFAGHTKIQCDAHTPSRHGMYNLQDGRSKLLCNANVYQSTRSHLTWSNLCVQQDAYKWT